MRYKKIKLKIIWILIFIFFIIIGILIFALISINNKAKRVNASLDTAVTDEVGEETIDGDNTNNISGNDTEDSVSDGVPEESGKTQTVDFFNDYYKQPHTDFTVYDLREPVVVKGIYVTANIAGIDEYFDELVELCAATEINAMVIDVKKDTGEIAFKNEIPIADEIGVSVNLIPDIRKVIEKLNENGIYPIARIVAFKDNGAWEKRPDLYIKNSDGSIWRDSSDLKSAWLNPYNKDAWDYILESAKAAVDVGFKEIQFDYIRFDTSSRLDDADFGDTMGKSRIEIITEFTKYASEKIKGWGAFVSADVYGTIIASNVDAAIVGQDYSAMAEHLDYICPMVYPSHYANKTFGIEYPDTEPYEVILNAMQLSNKVLAEHENAAVVRPWLQGFTASYLKSYSKYIPYTPAEVRAQIQAVYDSGLTEWIIWNSSTKYNSESFLTESDGQ